MGFQPRQLQALIGQEQTAGLAGGFDLMGKGRPISGIAGGKMEGYNEFRNRMETVRAGKSVQYGLI